MKTMLSIYLSVMTVVYAHGKKLSHRTERGGGGGSIEVLLLIGAAIAAAAVVVAFVARYIASNMPG